jgi:hypothetical protein
MTPKEKAEEIYNKCLDKIQGLEGTEWWESAKQCALIAVDEIINCLDDDDLYIQGESNIDGFISYYKEVKQEIEKL